MTRVVVIGSAGFLGGALTRALTAAGASTSGFTRQTPFVMGDGSPAMELRRADAIVYLAGSVTPATAERGRSAVAVDLRVFDQFVTCLRHLDQQPQ